MYSTKKQNFATNANTHTDAVLSDLAFTRMAEPDEHIHDRILPNKYVDRGADKYYYANNNHLKIPNTDRGGISDANMVDFDYSTGTYFATMKSLAHFIPDEMIQDADDYIKRNYEKDATEYLTWMIRQDKEKRAATLCTDLNTLTYNETLTGTAQFSDYNNSNPIQKIKTRMQTLHLQGGKKPNTIIFSAPAWYTTSEHPQVLDRAPNYNRSTLGVNQETFKEILKQSGIPIENVIVAESTYNTASEGATDSFSYIWGTGYIILCYIDPSALNSSMKKTLGVCFTPKYLDGIFTKKYRLPNKLGLFIEVLAKYALAITCPEMAWLIAGAI